jgi:hypothetical protein
MSRLDYTDFIFNGKGSRSRSTIWEPVLFNPKDGKIQCNICEFWKTKIAAILCFGMWRSVTRQHFSDTAFIKCYINYILKTINYNCGWDGVVCTATVCGQDGRRSNPCEGRQYLFSRRVQTGSGTQQAFSTLGSLAYSRGWSVRGMALSSHPLLVLSLKMGRAIPLPPFCSDIALLLCALWILLQENFESNFELCFYSPYS